MEILVILVSLFIASVIYSMVSTGRQVKKWRAELESHFGHAPRGRADINSVSAFWHQRRAAHPEAEAVDDITWNDLDMDEVFHRLNACRTTVGEEWLYVMLRECRPVPEGWEHYLNTLRGSRKERTDLQCLLGQLGKAPFSGLSAFLTGLSMSQTLGRFPLVCMSVLPFAALVSMTVIGYAGLILCLLSAFINLVYSFRFNQKTQGSLAGAQYLAKMLWCTGKISRIHLEGLEPLLTEIRDLNGIFKPLKSRLSSLASENMNASMGDMLGQYARWFLLSDVRAYEKSARVIKRRQQEVLSLYEHLGRLDILIAVCSFRKSLGAVCVPEFRDGLCLSMERMGHPLLACPVENSCVMTRGTLITGSNASGKSTFIKAVAVNALLAQAINTCAARAFIMPRARIISSMALKDSVTGGDSYFVAEIKSLKRIVETARQRTCLCFIDEILRGTNTVERIAASAAVLHYLSGSNCLCLVASHDIELTRILENDMDNVHFEETVTDGGVAFDYTLKHGASRTRNAILLLSTMGFSDTVIHQADALVASFESSNVWPVFSLEEGDHAAALP